MWKLVICISLFVAYQAHGEAMDNSSEEAMKDTKAMMNDPQLRDKAIKENSKTKDANDFASHVTGGGENLNEAYGLSTEIFEFLTTKYKGDAKELEQALLQAQSNPEAFYNTLPVELRNKVRGLAAKVPNSAAPQH